MMAERLCVSGSQWFFSEAFGWRESSSAIGYHLETACMTSDEQLGIDISASEVGSRLDRQLEARYRAGGAWAGSRATTYKSLIEMTFQAAEYNKEKIEL